MFLLNRIKKIFAGVAVIAFVAVCAFMFLDSDLEHIEDTNGPDNYELQTITDSNIINMDIGALNYSKSKDTIGKTETYSSKKFTGVAEIFGSNYKATALEFSVNHNLVREGNFKLCLLVDDEIVHVFKPNELMQTYRLEDVEGYVSLRIAGESANFKFDYMMY